MAMWRIWAAAALLAWGGAGWAQAPEQSVIDQLARQGYLEFEVSRTLLGRIRVVALGPNGERREIVFNPATGEILRDLLEDGTALPRVLDRPAEPEAAFPDESTGETWSGPDEVAAGTAEEEDPVAAEADEPAGEAWEPEEEDPEEEEDGGGSQDSDKDKPKDEDRGGGDEG